MVAVWGARIARPEGPRLPRPASRRALRNSFPFGETPNGARGTRALPNYYYEVLYTFAGLEKCIEHLCDGSGNKNPAGISPGRKHQFCYCVSLYSLAQMPNITQVFRTMRSALAPRGISNRIPARMVEGSGMIDGPRMFTFTEELSMTEPEEIWNKS